MLKCKIAEDVVFQNIKAGTLTRVVSVFQDLAETERQLAQLKSDLLKGKHCISNDDYKKLLKLPKEFNETQSDFKQKLERNHIPTSFSQEQVFEKSCSNIVFV